MEDLEIYILVFIAVFLLVALTNILIHIIEKFVSQETKEKLYSFFEKYL
jgi:hypothetical protein